MNKVITINLGGIAFQLEDAGYDALAAYLENAKARLAGNPDRDEILSDIERAIGDKFRATLGSHKNVVLEKEVRDVLAQMGQVEDNAEAAAGSSSADPGAAGNAAGAAAAAGRSTADGAMPKRLYRIQDGAMAAGVCNGLGAYFNLDPVLFRLAFVFLTMAWGAGVLVYLVMAIVVPPAVTLAEKAAATGSPWTAQDFIRRARQGYYEATKSFGDRDTRREWSRRFKDEMREWGASFRREAWDRSPASGWGMDPAPGAALALPFASIVQGALLIGWLSAIVSLLATGAVLGVTLPAGIAAWGALLLLLIAYGLVSHPVKSIRRAFYAGGWRGRGPEWSVFLVVDVVIWTAVVVVLIWLGLHHSDQVRDAIQHLPDVFHEAVDAITTWWNRA